MFQLEQNNRTDIKKFEIINKQEEEIRKKKTKFKDAPLFPAVVLLLYNLTPRGLIRCTIIVLCP